MSGITRKEQSCCMCNKSAREVARLFTGFSGGICDECVMNAHRLLAKEVREFHAHSIEVSMDAPSGLVHFLDQYVVGQSSAKSAIAVAVYLHGLRASYLEEGGDVEIEKSNILLLGPTGSGKSMLAETIARCLNVPFAFVDATKFTEAGYVGDDVEVMLERLLQDADGDVSRAEKGIVYIDEIDKITHRSQGGAAYYRDPRGSGVQHALLRMLEGTMARVAPPGVRRTPTTELLTLNTRHILFICGGAFPGIEDIVHQRLRDGSAMGFTSRIFARSSAPVGRVEPEDLIRYGMEAEFVGRLPVIAELEQLTTADLRRILVEPKHALLKQYAVLCERAGGGTQVHFSDAVLGEIAQVAHKRSVGARGLRGITDALFQPIFVELPDRVKRGERVTAIHIDTLGKPAEFIVSS